MSDLNRICGILRHTDSKRNRTTEFWGICFKYNQTYQILKKMLFTMIRYNYLVGQQVICEMAFGNLDSNIIQISQDLVFESFRSTYLVSEAFRSTYSLIAN